MKISWTSCALLLSVLSFTAGCSGGADDEPERVVVFGKVTYAGVPVESGEIRFTPAEGTNAPSAGSTIAKGSYRIDHKGGVPVGTFQVIVMSYKARAGNSEVPGAVNDPMGSREQVLPDKYSTSKSKLQFTVEPGKEMVEKDFELDE